jgi:hypothetical protein
MRTSAGDRDDCGHLDVARTAQRSGKQIDDPYRDRTGKYRIRILNRRIMCRIASST